MWQLMRRLSGSDDGGDAHGSEDDATYTYDHHQQDMAKFVALVMMCLVCRHILVRCGNSGLIGYLLAGMLAGPEALDIVPHYFVSTLTVLGRLGVW